MSITASMVKDLRERTGAGMMECKKALVESDGDLDAAAEALRTSGQAKADKKASRVAADGKVVIKREGDKAGSVCAKADKIRGAGQGQHTKKTTAARQAA